MSTLAAPGLYVKNNRAAATQDESLSFVDQLWIYYQRSKQRSLLMTLDDRMLKDIGISRVDALRVARKPFWQA
jgi:uncharacterized protein YjiS (DUF1127 family)